MGFEVLAGLKQQLAEQAKRHASKKDRVRARPEQAEQTAQDPALFAISRLQRHYPEAFPRKPAPKRPLKVGVFDDLSARAEHGLDATALRLALTAWCQGRRYWECLKPGEARVDVTGAVAGEVTPAQAQRAKQLLRQHRQNGSPQAATRTSPSRTESSKPTPPTQISDQAGPRPRLPTSS